MDTQKCTVCMEIKNMDEFYNYTNKTHKVCKKCKLRINSERILCECNRYYTRTHKIRHINTKVHKNLVGKNIDK